MSGSLNKYSFELEEVCFGEDIVCSQQEVDSFIRDLLKVGFYATDDEDCSEPNEIRICLHHLEGKKDKDLGYYWLKFKVNQKTTDDNKEDC